MHKFEIYKDKKGESRFRFRAGNGEIMFSSEGYKSKASAIKTIESIRKNAPGAPLEDLSAATKVSSASKAKAAPKAKAADKPKATAKAAAKPKAKTAAKAKSSPKAKAVAAPA